jgi:hypothetical protein
MTGGGVHWMFQKGNVNIFDISKVQVAFINLLLQDWNGENYGEFVYHFITKNKIKHFHVNLNETQNSNKDLISNKQQFIEKINANFETLKNKYDPDWKWNSKKNVKVQQTILLVKKLNSMFLCRKYTTKYKILKNTYKCIGLIQVLAGEHSAYTGSLTIGRKRTVTILIF